MTGHSIMKHSWMVFPSLETPNHTLSLPGLDTVLRSPFSHTPLLYVYPSKNNKNNNNNRNSNNNSNSNNNHSKCFNINILKTSLSKVLVPFYPLAGRLRKNPKTNHLEITCNAKGVLFVETSTNNSLSDFGDFEPSHALREIAFPAGWDSSMELSRFPLLMVQLTRFKCGGVMLGVMVNHNVVDGISTAYFVNSWSRLVRGFDIEVWPCHDRVRCVGPREPPLVKFTHLEYEPPLSRIRVLCKTSSRMTGDSKSSMSTTTICKLFKFSKAQISALKQHPKFQQLNPKPTTYAIVAAHLWRCICKARDLPSHQEVRLYVPTNGRSRLKHPSLPQGYFGNVLFRGLCIAQVADVACKPLWHTTSKVQDALIRMDDNEYLRSAIDYLALNPGLSSLNPSLTWMEQESCPNLSINCWFGIPFGEADFGTGGPSCVRLGGVGYEGQVLIMPSMNGDGSVIVSINLSNSHMDLLKKYIYDFGEIHAAL